MLIVSSTTQAAKTDPSPAEAASAKTKTTATEKAPERSTQANKEAEDSAYEKLRLDGKLTIERPVPEAPVPEEPTPAPEPAPQPERIQEQGPESPPQESAMIVPVLPGPTPEVAPQEAPAPQAPEAQVPAPSPPEEIPPPAPVPLPKPADTRLSLTIPRLGLIDVTVGDSPRQSYLDREGIMHLSGTGFPFKRGSNTYIAGHAGDYDRSRVPNVFRNLNALRRGDVIALRDANGKNYNYRVYERLVVNPHDVWVMDPIPGKKVVTLQTCFPVPTYETRLIIRGELVK